MSKYEQFQLALAEVSQIKELDSYHTIFLSTMLLRKIRHPEEGLREVTTKTMKTMVHRYSHKKLEEKSDEKMRQVCMVAVNKSPETYGKMNLVAVSVTKCIEGLEEALEKSGLPEEMEQRREGATVKFVFDYLTDELKKKMEMLSTIKA